MKDIEIYIQADGWDVVIDDKWYSWNHNEEDLGTNAIAELLRSLGHNVVIEEDY